MIGQTISHYKILAKLGGGGMGVVYKAEDTKLKRFVALKFLPPDLTRDEEAKERFIHEAQAASALDHPNICTIYEIDETEDGRMFIAMAYYEGETLKKKIERGPLSIDQTLDLAIQIAQGVAKAHEHGITHRDIKPANVMITKDGVVKIVDFGLAKLVGQSRLTKAGMTLGTVAYMSPEQTQGEDVDHRTDIWSFGVVLYEMLTGQLPFKGEYEPAVVYSILNENPKPLKELRPDVPLTLTQINDRALEKDRQLRYPSAAEVLKDLTNCQSRFAKPQLELAESNFLLRRIMQPKVAIAGVLIILMLGFIGIKFFERQGKVSWARQLAIPEIMRLAEEGEYVAAFELARKAEPYIPNDSLLIQLWPQFSRHISILTMPPGAEVLMKEYKAINRDWEHYGPSPIHRLRVPLELFRLKILKAEYITVEGAFHPLLTDTLKYTLDKEGSIPHGMVQVPGGTYSVLLVGLEHLKPVRLEEYWIDKFEVSNKQFKEFIDNGGYEKRDYWKHQFIKDGHTLSWEKAMAEFRDATGRPGPLTWELGDYPDGQHEYPVTGVSWHEAAAYAEFAGKILPTIFHWNTAAETRASSYIIPLSNFSDRGPAPVGSYQGLGVYGTYDMAGNVREWCFNENSQNQRFISGGGWNDQTYLFNDAYAQLPFDRSSTNGFRCAKYLEGPENLALLTRRIERAHRDFMKEKPVSDEVFNIYRRMYAYDKAALNARVESVDDRAENWIKEKITFDAAYGNERMIAYLFLPKNFAPPYQTIVYFPGSDAIHIRSSASLRIRLFDFMIKSGRAVMHPIYKGTYEREDDLHSDLANETNSYKEHVIQWAKDLGRSIDYLQTRPDIDMDKLAYYGTSWGGVMGAIMPAVEKRLKVSILTGAGLEFQRALPEVDVINFVTRIKIPTLMLNGRYDHYFPVESSQRPMFQLLGTPAEHKRQVICESGHSVPRNLRIKEILDWLDRYFGPVR